MAGLRPSEAIELKDDMVEINPEKCLLVSDGAGRAVQTDDGNVGIVFQLHAADASPTFAASIPSLARIVAELTVAAMSSGPNTARVFQHAYSDAITERLQDD